MKVNKSIRLRTEPGLSKNISVKIEQEFDTIDFLSLQITQQEAYRNFCSDYGVVAGRVIANDGFGIANAKVSIFIPLSDEDAEDPTISQIYPYVTPTDQNDDGVRYNLLPRVGKNFFVRVKIPNDVNGDYQNPNSITDAYSITSLGTFVTGSIWELVQSESQSGAGGFGIYQREVVGNSGPKVPVGTFPTKFEILDDDTFLEVYDKYYRLSTKTNDAGDYMIFGVPIGTKTVHMDVDLSDTGSVSLTPADFISQGFSPDLFTADFGFPSSTNLDSLPQIESQNLSVDVVPFWGDLEQCEIGITRLDFNLNKKIVPSALLVFQAFTNGDGFLRADNNLIGPGSVNSSEYRDIGNMVPLDVTVACTRGAVDADIKIQEKFQDGNVIISLPMYSDFKVTNEQGELVDGEDGKGVPTGGRYSTFVWGTSSRHIGSEKERGTALHNIYFVKYRYDLLNRKRLIYTPGMSILTRDKNTTILGLTSGNKLSFPTNSSIDGKCFGQFGQFGQQYQSPVFGSLYFPMGKQQSDGDINSIAYKKTDFYAQFGGSTTIHTWNSSPYAVGVLDITDILHIFKPFGGGFDPTSANNGTMTNYPNTPPTSPEADDSSASGELNQNNQTFLLRGDNEGASGQINFPNRLNQIQFEDIDDNGFAIINPQANTDGNATILYGTDPNSGQQSKRGRYYFYFGLTKSNNILERLKTVLE